MKSKTSHKSIWFRLGALLTVIALVSLWMPTPQSTAQQDIRQLKRDQTQPNGATARRIALVIGNGAYPTAPLKNPVNDAHDIAAALGALGFEVISRENANQNDMKRAIREFGEKIRGAAVGLFYYAGHGVQVNGENFLVPVDAKVESEQEVEYECVKAGFVLAQMDAARNTMNIVILDACRNNPFARSYRSESKGLAQMDAPSGTLIAYATAPGSIASDGAGRNGLYTQELLKQMQTSGLAIEDVFKRVRISVRAVTQQKQTPWESSSLVGAFYFKNGPANSNSVVQDATPSVVDYNRVFSSHEVDQRVKTLSIPQPQYTEEARKNQVQGVVVLNVVFAASGEVTNVTVVSGLPHGLSERAIEAAKQIRFEPARKDGRPVSQAKQFVYHFNLY